MREQKIESRHRLLAKIVWGLLKEESCETLADLTDALKSRLARLHIRWTNDEISDAYRLIQSNHPLVPVRDVDPPLAYQDPAPMGCREAACLVATLRARLAMSEIPIRPVPDVRSLTPQRLARRQWRADHLQAYRLVEHEMLETARRGELLERVELVKADRRPASAQQKETA